MECHVISNLSVWKDSCDRQQLLSLGFQAKLFFQGEGGQKNTNAGPESEKNSEEGAVKWNI